MHSAFVYRTYDDDDNLLYVGCAVEPSHRLYQHSNQAAWWRDVADVSVRGYPTRERALAVEARAIRILTPIWNRQGVRQNVQRRKEAEMAEKRRAEAVERLNAADPKAKPIKSLETWRRWLRDGCPGADD